MPDEASFRRLHSHMCKPVPNSKTKIEQAEGNTNASYRAFIHQVKFQTQIFEEIFKFWRNQVCKLHFFT